jgi:hypothetical protein
MKGEDTHSPEIHGEIKCYNCAMITKELLEYIEAQRAAGQSDYQIRQSLSNGSGWDAADIDEGFQKARNPGSQVTPVPQAPQAQSQAQLSQKPELSQTPSQPQPQFQPQPRAAQPTQWHPPVQGGGKTKYVIIALAILLVLGAAGAYGFWGGFFSLPSLSAKPPYSEGELFSGVLSKLLTIKSTRYSVSTNLRTAERESGASPFQPVAVSEQKKASYGNDVERASDVQKIYSSISSLNPYGSAAKTYPKSLADLIASIKAKTSYSYYSIQETDPLGKPYDYRAKADGSGFTLAVTFETQEAVDQLKKYSGGSASKLEINGKTVVFTEKNNGYIFLSSQLPTPILVTLSDYMKSAPANMEFNSSIGGTFNGQNEGKPGDGQVTLDFSGTFDDLSIAASAEVRKLGKDYYVILNKFPSLFFFSILAPIKGQWIKLTSDYTSTSSMGIMGGSTVRSIGTSISSADSSYRQNRQRAADDLKMLMRIADQTKLFAFKAQPVLVKASDKASGQDQYKYDLVMKKDNLLAFFKALSAESKNASASDPIKAMDADGMVTYLNDPASAPVLDYMTKNLFFTLWTDAAGMPLKWQTRFRIVPPDTAVQLKDKQVDVVTSLSLSDINKPINVSIPDKFITADEADKLMESNSPYGAAREKSKDARLISDAQQMRTFAETEFKGNSYSSGLTSNNRTAKQGGGIISKGSAKQLLDDVAAQGSMMYAITNSGPTSYAIYVRLISDSTRYFCIDSTGRTMSSTNRNTGATCN